MDVRCGFSLLVVLSLAACGGGKEARPDPEGAVRKAPLPEPSSSEPSSLEHAGRHESTPPPAQDASMPRLPARLKFKGNRECVLEPRDDGAKLSDAGGAEIARYVWKSGRWKVKNAGDEVLGYVRRVGAQWRIEDADKHEKYSLRRTADGRFKLKDAAGAEVYEVEPRDYGFKIKDGAEQEVAKVKQRGGKTSLRDGAEHTVWYTKGEIRAEAVAVLAFEPVTLPVRFGLLLAMTAGEGQ